MPPSLSSPGRLTPAGPGRPSELTGPMPDMERVLGALRDFTRRDILLRFYADRKVRTVDEVAHDAGIHRSVAFEHLERLVALGYLEVERRRGFPGKPAKMYRLTAGPVQISHPMRRYDVLAEALARGLVEVDVAAFRVAGRSLGRALSRPGEASLAAALEPLVEMGAEYEAGPGDRIVCQNCLFAEVCRRVSAICDFHAGVLEGVLAGVGEHTTVRSLGFSGSSGCAYLMER